jgi:hypothetical protein
MHGPMLPILRILPVGGVLLAIFILVLALSPPDGSRSPLTAPARGALVDRDHHPEVRQFLILAALKRATELKRLRELAEMPTPSSSSQVASLPTDRSDTDPEETGSINETPGVSIPVEIGEPSSTELPVASREEDAPTVKNPEPARPQREFRRRATHRAHRTKAMAGAASGQQFNLFEALFGGQQHQQLAYRNQQASQQYQQPSYATQQSTQHYQQPPYVVPQANQSVFSTVPRTAPY